MACSFGHLALAETLIQHGAAVDLQSNEGSTPLHNACVMSQKLVAEMLIRNGCNYTLTDHVSNNRFGIFICPY